MREVRFRPRARLDALSAYGLVGFAVAAALHAATFTGRSISPQHPLFFAMHVGIFPLFLAFVLRARRWSVAKRGMLGFRTESLRWRELLPYFPRWVPVLVVVLFAYVLANFFLSMSMLPEGTPASDLTAAESAYTVRAFSGHWLVFYALPALYFSFVPRDARPAAPADAEPT